MASKKSKDKQRLNSLCPRFLATALNSVLNMILVVASGGAVLVVLSAGRRFL